MMGDALNKPTWNTILVYDSSRIFRSQKDSTLYKALLRDNEIRIVSTTEHFPDSDEGWLAEGMTDLWNELYSRQTRRKTHAGMSVKANKATHCGGVPPLGYDVDADGMLVINAEEAETVREIFRLFDLGYSLNGMAEELNRQGMKTKAGRPFTKNSFYDILTQKKYIGIYSWNKRRAKNSKGQHNNHAYKPQEKQIVIPGGCPAIIPLEQFQKVQEELSKRKQGKADTKRRHHYMLSSLKILKCSECGAYMVGKVIHSHGKKYTAYACPHHKGGECPTKDINAETLEEYVANITVDSIVTKSNISQLNELAENCSEEKLSLQNRIRGLDKKIDNLTKNLESTFSQSLSERLSQLELERDNLVLQEETANAEALHITDENLEQFKEDLSNYIKTSDAPDVKEVLKAYVQEVLVSNDGAKVTLQL